MTAKTLAELALKIWGVILLLGSILSLPGALWMSWIVPSGDPPAALMRASQFGFLLSAMVDGLGGLVILVWADRIVALFEADDTRLQIDVTSKEVQVLAFAIVGVLVLIDGVQNVAAAGYVLLRKPPEVETTSYMLVRQSEGMIKGIVQLAAGALLVFGRETLGQGWARLRAARGMDDGDSDDDDEG